MTTVTARPLVANSVLELIGSTPLVRLNRVNPPGTTLLGKLENLNPGGSVKFSRVWRSSPKPSNAGSAHRTPPRGTSATGSNSIGASRNRPTAAATRSMLRVVATPSGAPSSTTLRWLLVDGAALSPPPAADGLSFF